MITVSCHRCGVPIFLTEDQHKILKQSSQTFYCLWGHGGHYPQGPTEADKLRQERDRLKQELAYKDDVIRAEKANARFALETAERAKRSAAAVRGEVTKMRNRAIAGVCPCCNRTFSQLARHMKSKHPGFKAEAVN